MNKTFYLDKASGILFVLGSLIAKLQYVPLAVASLVFRFTSQGIYIAAYSSWFLASVFRIENDPRYLKSLWLKIKEHHILASTLGLLATTLAICSFFFPLLAIPASWSFFISNAIATFCEYRKLKNPPCDEKEFSSSKQQSFLYYSLAMTSISLITALATTSLILFPVMTLHITLISVMIVIGLTLTAINSIRDYYYGDHEPDSLDYSVNSSYPIMTSALSPRAVLNCSQSAVSSPDNDACYPFPLTPLSRSDMKEDTPEDGFTTRSSL